MSGAISMGGFAALRRFAEAQTPAERCELCGQVLPATHEHLLEPHDRRIHCACQACAILFSGTDLRYRRVPKRVVDLAPFQLSEIQWQALMLPINLAFFFQSAAAGPPVAFYPSPAGAVQSSLQEQSWAEIVLANPALGQMEPAVEALLVNRLGSSHGFADHEYYRTPMDVCFELCGVIRRDWRGLSGGRVVRQEIHRFFGHLKSRARPSAAEAPRA